MPRPFAFDPARIAYFEAHGWRAYYDRAWLTLARLLVGLCHEQFRIPFPWSLLAAYDVTRASLAWAPVDHDPRVVRVYYERFYRLAKKYSALPFDPARAGLLELRYNDDHRRFVGASNKSDYLKTMTELHAELFGLTLEAARPSAELRVEATNLVDGITGKTSLDIEGDWRRIEDCLLRCYQSIQEAMNQTGADVGG